MWAAGQRTWCHGFCNLDNFIMTRGSQSITGRAKTTPPLLRTATHQTAGPLAASEENPVLKPDQFILIRSIKRDLKRWKNRRLKREV
jgi:hypothetical protein